MTYTDSKAYSVVFCLILLAFSSPIFAGQNRSPNPVILQDIKPDSPDIIPLSVPGQIILHWTAPGDDGNIGRADHYIIKYSSNIINSSNWNSAITAPNPPAPLSAGLAQSFTISGLNRGVVYYFAIKTYDEAGNVSGLSNVARKFAGGIITPAPKRDIVDSLNAIAILQADTVAAAQRLLYQFALDTALTFPTPSVAIDSVIDSLALVSYSNLRRNDTYYWRVRAIFIDRTDTSLWSSIDTFFMPNIGDVTPPVLSNIRALNITPTTATIAWTTNETATSQVDYGTTSGYGLSTTLDPGLLSSHSQGLAGLASSTTYHYRVKSRDAAGNIAISGDNTFVTTIALPIISVGVPDTVCGTFAGYTKIPINDGVISPRGGTSTTWASDQDATLPHWVEMSFSVSMIVQRVSISWAWNNSNSTWMCSRQYSIQYWNSSTNSYQNAASVNNSTADSATTTDFAPVTTTKIRYWQPASMGPINYVSILWVTELQIFGSPADITPPVISNIATTNLTSSSVTITWGTNEPATSQVDYGTTTGYGLSTTLDPVLLSSHSQGLTGLTSSTTYHYRVRSRDASGNLAISGDNAFVTPSSLQLISVNMPDTECGTYPGYSTTPVNDGVISPRGGTVSTWASDQSSTQAHWAEISFSGSKIVQRARIYWAWNTYNSTWMCSRQYNIQYWNTSTNSYLDAAIVNNSTVDSVTTTDFTPVTTTKIRYWQPVNMGPVNYVSILWLTELQLYGSNPIGLLAIKEKEAFLNDQNPNLSSLNTTGPNGISSLTMPEEYSLAQSYPNPFNASATIEYGLPASAQVSIDIYDITGRLILALVNEYQEPGFHKVVWNAGNQSSGTYFYRIAAGDFIETKRMMLLK